MAIKVNEHIVLTATPTQGHLPTNCQIEFEVEEPGVVGRYTFTLPPCPAQNIQAARAMLAIGYAGMGRHIAACLNTAQATKVVILGNDPRQHPVALVDLSVTTHAPVVTVQFCVTTNDGHPQAAINTAQAVLKSHLMRLHDKFIQEACFAKEHLNPATFHRHPEWRDVLAHLP